MTSGDGTAPRRSLRPGLWGAIVGLLVIVVVVLAALLLLGFGGDDVTEVIVQECTVGEPGCELRQGVHWHANFAVFLNGEAYDFNDPRFLVEDPDDPRENVNLHEPRYTVVHVHREQTTFDEFFKSLEWKLTDSCITTIDGEEYCNNDAASLKFVVNGVRIDSLRFQDITDLARVLISYGDETDEQLMEQFDLVGDDACISSELCRDRAPAAGIKPEPCSGRGACN
jgi:hypothetical protein